MNKSPHPLTIFFVLLLLSITAFQARLENFSKNLRFTIDEEVYYRLGRQLNLKDGWENYNTIEFAKELERIKGAPLPDYFYRPLFKYPPVFPAWISIAIRLCGDCLASAVYVSCAFGALLIPLGYLLGCQLAGWPVGILAAVFLWVDPIVTMASQKVWMDTTVSFFMLLSVWGYIKGWDSSRGRYFFLAGIAAGLATLTKYLGILPVGTVLLGMAVSNPTRLKDPKFLASLLIPGLLLIPWIFWNWQVYGNGFLTTQAHVHGVLSRNSGNILTSLCLIVVLIFLKTRIPLFVGNYWRKVRRHFKVAVASAFLIWLLPSIYLSLRIDIFPPTSWEAGLFQGENFSFYVRHLLEFSFFYIFAYGAYFFPHQVRETTNARVIIMTTALGLFVFYSLWGNYQSRYILPAIPLLLVLSSQAWWVLFQRAGAVADIRHKLFFQGLLLLTLAVSFYKMYIFNLLVSSTNNMCYF